MVQRALLKLQTEVVAQVRVQHFTCNNTAKEEVSRYTAVLLLMEPAELHVDTIRTQ